MIRCKVRHRIDGREWVGEFATVQEKDAWLAQRQAKADSAFNLDVIEEDMTEELRILAEKEKARKDKIRDLKGINFNNMDLDGLKIVVKDLIKVVLRS